MVDPLFPSKPPICWSGNAWLFNFGGTFPCIYCDAEKCDPHTKPIPQPFLFRAITISIHFCFKSMSTGNLIHNKLWIGRMGKFGIISLIFWYGKIVNLLIFHNRTDALQRLNLLFLCNIGKAQKHNICFGSSFFNFLCINFEYGTRKIIHLFTYSMPPQIRNLRDR